MINYQKLYPNVLLHISEDFPARFKLLIFEAVFWIVLQWIGSAASRSQTKWQQRCLRKAYIVVPRGLIYLFDASLCSRRKYPHVSWLMPIPLGQDPCLGLSDNWILPTLMGSSTILPTEKTFFGLWLYLSLSIVRCSHNKNLVRPIDISTYPQHIPTLPWTYYHFFLLSYPRRKSIPIVSPLSPLKKSQRIVDTNRCGREKSCLEPGVDQTVPLLQKTTATTIYMVNITGFVGNILLKNG